jgi:hypothetical protein
MSEVISVRLPPELFKLMVGEAESRGMSLSMLLKEIIEKHYGFKHSKPLDKPFIVRLEEALDTLGRAKMEGCNRRGDCPLKVLGVDPSPTVCGLCQIHSHAPGLFETSTFNPYAGLTPQEQTTG